MNEKQSIIQLMAVKAVLKAMTPEAKNSIPRNMLEQDMVRISQFPFKVGREMRIKKIGAELMKVERVKSSDREPTNDLYLTDTHLPRHISKEHFRIEKNSSGYILIDCCSECGTTVGTTRIEDQDSTSETKLEDGDIIAVGTKKTPYLFKFITLESQGQD
jgi:hypothetical protein